MWVNILIAGPFFLSTTFLLYFYLFFNKEVITTYLYDDYWQAPKQFNIKDFTQNIYLMWQFIILILLIEINFLPVYIMDNSFFSFVLWKKILYTITLVLLLISCVLLLNTTNNFKYLIYNEFFIILLLLLPTLSFLLLISINFIFLYLVLEIFAYLLLVLLYTTNLLKKPTKFNLLLFSKQSFYMIFFQLVLNFFSSIIMALLIIFFLQKYGVISYELISRFFLLNQSLVKYSGLSEINPSIYLFIFFITKFGVGPWFQYKIEVYRYLPYELLYVYIFIYFLILMPMGIFIVVGGGFFYNLSLALISIFFLTIIYWVFLNIFKINSISSLLGVSSVVLYSFIVFQLVILF